MSGKPIVNRRDILCSVPMLTATLLLPDRSFGQSTRPVGFEGLGNTYGAIGQKFKPTVSVGNVCGKVVDLPVFEQLAQSAPANLTAAFEKAMIALTSRSIISASSDYFDFRAEAAGNRIDRATLAIAGDVSNDQAIIIIIGRVIEHDLAVAENLERDESLSVSKFRVQMLQLREQQHLLRAEERRVEGGAAVYLPIQERSRRSLKAENVYLENEVMRLRAELSTVQSRLADLIKVVLAR